jgi:translocation and assembly module TamB
VPQREGELRYRVAIDSLSAFAGLVGIEEGETPPRPLILARRLESARSDSARIAVATEVERAATGLPPPRLQVDTPRVVPRDVVAGSLRAEGVARGNIRRVSLRGTASGENIVARGNIVDRFTAEYDWKNVGKRDAHINASAYAAGTRLAGFEFDTVNVRVDHFASQGRADIAVRQDDRRTYAMNADYELHPEHDEVHLNSLRLQFDTTVWQSVRSSTVQWGGRGIEIDNLELTAGQGRRLFVDGLLPSEGEGDLHVVAENFELGDISAFLQSDVSARGLVSFDVRARGTAEDPSFTGTASGQNVSWAGTTFPRMSGTFSYADETLTGRFDAARETGESLVSAEGTIPINLALQGVRGSRIPRDRQIALRVSADSFPVGLFPQLTRLVSNVTARTSGSFTMGGTLRRPEFSGTLAVSEGGARFVPLGIRVNNIVGSLTMTGDTIVIDSLVGNSGGGPVRIAGGIGVGSFREPSFNLQLIARNARVLNNHLGRLKADIELTLYGPFAGARITGGIRLREGVLYMPEPDDKQVIGAGDPALFNVLDTAVTADKELFPAQSPLLANLYVDISLRVDRGVFVRSKDANVEVYSDGDLTLIADRSKEILKLDGILLSDRGDYVFLQKRFRIRRGSATFVGLSEINPTLQVTGEYEVRLPAREAILIQIIIGGTLLAPKIELRSTAQPPLSQSDLLSYLAFGRPSTSLTQLQGGALTSGNASGQLIGVGAALAVKQVATVALGVFTDEMAGEAAQSLGADVFIITPADVQTDVGNFLRGTEFEFGKYLRPTTFLALQARPDPESLRRPGFQLEHRFPRLRGYQLRLTLEPRYILREPTLADQEPKTRSAFGAFLIREWRY